MDELELIKMAVFKIGETARRMNTLANAAQTLQGRRLLAGVAQRLVLQEQELRAGGLPDLAACSDQPPRAVDKTPAAGPAVKNIQRLVPLAKRRSQGRLSIPARAAQ